MIETFIDLHRENRNLRAALAAAAEKLTAPAIVNADELLTVLGEISLELCRIDDRSILPMALHNNIGFCVERIHDALNSIPQRLTGDAERWAARMMKLENRLERAKEILAGKDDR